MFEAKNEDYLVKVHYNLKQVKDGFFKIHFCCAHTTLVLFVEPSQHRVCVREFRHVLSWTDKAIKFTVCNNS